MIIPIEKILSNEPFEIEEIFESLSLPGEIELSSPVNSKLRISHGSDKEVVVEGEIKVKLLLNCVSCLEKFEEEFEIEVNEAYLPEDLLKTRGEEREPSELDTFSYRGDELDTESIVRDIIAGSIPVYPKCPDCRES
jgi:uncharacterized metal-binding protein YceD (DUF177 family)